MNDDDKQRAILGMTGLLGASFVLDFYSVVFYSQTPWTMYYVLLSPLYIAFSVFWSLRSGDKAGPKFAVYGGLLGLLLSFIFSALSITIASFLPAIFPVIAALFPSSIFWMALDAPADTLSLVTIFSVYGSAILVNGLLYAVLGCVLYQLWRVYRPLRRLPLKERINVEA